MSNPNNVDSLVAALQRAIALLNAFDIPVPPSIRSSVLVNFLGTVLTQFLVVDDIPTLVAALR